MALSNEKIDLKLISTSSTYITYAEVKLESHITPDYFKRFFKVLRSEVKNITPECTSIREICIEENRFSTTVETFKFPFVSERYSVLTGYFVDDYKNIPGSHIYFASGRGN
jgi:hypothetical protein